MPRPKAELQRYVPERWFRWLSRIFNEVAAARGLDGSNPEAMRSISNEFARRIAHDRTDNNRVPRADVQAWLKGGAYVLPRRAFAVGQALGGFNGAPKSCSGIVALHASGHFPEAIACIIQLMSKSAYGESPYARTLEPFSPSVKHLNLEYAFTCVGALWTAHSDLDRIPDDQISVHERNLARAMIGTAPLAACQLAWNYTQPVTEHHGRLGVKNVPRIGLATKRGMRYDSALIWWAALAGETWQYAVRNPPAQDAWDRARPLLQQYMEIAHNTLIAPSRSG